MFLKIFDYLMKFLIFATVALWLLSIFKPELVKEFIFWIEKIINVLWYWNYLIVFLSWLIESFPILWVVVPGQNILLIVWWFFSKLSQTNLIYVIIIASIWAIISNYLGYILWKIYWDTFFKKYGNWFWIWTTEIKYLKNWIKKWGPLGIILGKFHNITRAFLPFIAWSMWMNSTSFFIYNIIWSILRATTIVILGVMFANYYESIIDYMWYLMMWIMLIIWLYIYKFKKKEFLIYLKEKNEELDAQYSKK